MELDDGEYEAIDYGDQTGPLPLPITQADLLASLRKTRSQDNSNLMTKQPALPPGKPRYTKDPVKNIPPPIPSAKKSAVPSIPPKPSSAPPTTKKPGRKSQTSTKVSSAPHDSKGFLSQSVDAGHFRATSPSIPPPVPSREEIEDQTLVLADLVRKYSKELPLRVRVEEGYCGNEERFVISAGDVYNFHFVKNEKVVSVSDCGSNHFSIPFFSEIKFGLLYNPDDNFKEAIKGYTFKSVSELVAASTTPRMVRVQTASPVSSPERSLSSKGELLVIKKAGKTVMRKPFIKVMNIKSKEERTLYDDSESSFTTEPWSLQLYIPEIMELFPDSFPLEAMMYPPGEDAEDLPPHLTTDIVTLTHISIESAIIATTHWEEEDENDEDQVPISIPIEMDIEVVLVDGVDDDELYMNTKEVLEHLDLSKVKDVKNDKPGAGRTSGSGRKLTHRVRKGYEFKAVDITLSQKVLDDPTVKSCAAFRSILNQPLPPPPFGLPSQSPAPPPITTPPHSFKPLKSAVPQSLPSKPSPGLQGKPQAFPPARSTSVDDPPPPPTFPRKPRSSTVSEAPPPPRKFENYINHTFKSPPDATPPLPKSPRHSQPTGLAHKVNNSSSESVDVDKLKEEVEFLRRLVNAMQENSQKETAVLQEQLSDLTATMATMSSNYKQLQGEVEGLKKSKGKRQQVTNGAELGDYEGLQLTKTVDPQKQQENMANLRAMGTPEMLHLLEVMHLPQYKQLFQEESIDGELLAECDEAILEQELHITNKLHRARLMKVITGRHSVTNIQHGLDPYGGSVPYYQ